MVGEMVRDHEPDLSAPQSGTTSTQRESWKRLGCEKIRHTFSLSVIGLHLEEDLTDKFL